MEGDLDRVPVDRVVGFLDALGHRLGPELLDDLEHADELSRSLQERLARAMEAVRHTLAIGAIMAIELTSRWRGAVATVHGIVSVMRAIAAGASRRHNTPSRGLDVIMPS